MTVYKFGPYILYKDTAVLKREGVTIPLTKRRYEMIRLLAERANQIVTKEELIESIWLGQFVNESNLVQLVYATRRLLGDTIREQNYIETIPGVGYRFRVPVEVIDTAEEPEIPAQADRTPSREITFRMGAWKYLLPVTDRKSVV